MMIFPARSLLLWGFLDHSWSYQFRFEAWEDIKPQELWHSIIDGDATNMAGGDMMVSPASMIDT